MGYLATIAILSEFTLYTLVLILILLMVVCKSVRPMFKIGSLWCVSTYVMPSYIGVSGGMIAAYYLSPDDTTDDQDTFITFLRFVGIQILAVHTLVFVPARLYLRRSIARWHALVLCEISKGLLCLTLILGLESIGSAASAAFIIFGVVAIVSALVPLIGRIATVCRLLCCNPEGFELQSFYQIYFGVESEDQHPPLIWECEKSDAAVQPEQAGTMPDDHTPVQAFDASSGEH